MRWFTRNLAILCDARQPGLGVGELQRQIGEQRPQLVQRCLSLGPGAIQDPEVIRVTGALQAGHVGTATPVERAEIDVSQ